MSESLDTARPAGRMVFTVLGAVAELERSLIIERVKAGLRNARAKGKRIGRPRVVVDRSRIGRLRAEGRSWLEITEETGVSHTARAPRNGPSVACPKSYELEQAALSAGIVLIPRELSHSRLVYGQSLDFFGAGFDPHRSYQKPR